MTGGWKYAAASEIGISHLKGEAPVCQDAHRCVYLDHADALLCVLSDGAGSASRAEQGSRLTCETVVRQARSADPDQIFSEKFAYQTLSAVRTALADLANASALGIRDYACTMLVAIASAERAVFWQIGDGAICVRVRGGAGFGCAIWPAKGEYANVTQFVTDDKAAEELVLEQEQMEIADLALFSDGLERLALDFKAERPHDPFFTALFPYLHRRPEGHLTELEEQIASFLGSDRVNSKTDDDKTLILASRESNAA